MTLRPHWGMSPRQSVEQECARRGERAVVSGCIAMLRGRPVDGELILALGGPPPSGSERGGQPGPDYWLRVWAARGLLYAWHGSARSAVRSALEDDSWRVREMAVRVVAERELHEAHATVEAMGQDPSARVRAAADKALLRLESRRGTGDPAVERETATPSRRIGSTRRIRRSTARERGRVVRTRLDDRFGRGHRRGTAQPV